MQSPEARDLARALRISVRYARHASRGIPGNEQAARACFVTWKSPTGTGDCVDAPALSSQALAASFLAPARVFVSHPPSLGSWALSMCDMLINPDLEATPLRLTFTV